MQNQQGRSRLFPLSRKECLLLLGLIALIALVFASGILDRQQTWADLNYGDVYVYPSLFLRTSEGAKYGVHTAGPYYSLPAGQYRLRLTVETDGGGTARLTNINGARIEPNTLVFSAGENMPALDFEILDAADDVQIEISFDSGTYLDLYDIRLYTPFYRDHAFTFAFILIGIALTAFLMHRGRLTRDELKTLLILLTAVTVCSAPVLKDNIAELIDLEFHMARLENLADGLRSGQFPVRAGGFTFNGYGAITSIFYPDILLVPFALLRLWGASPTYVLSVFCIACSLISGLTACYAGKRIFGNANAGLCAAILFICAPYRLNNLLIRGALGEGLAMSFYPLFILGLWEVVYGDSSKWRLLSAGAFLIFMSHLLSTVMAALMAAGICFLALPRLFREHRILPLLKALAATACLSLFFLVPMADMFSQGINADVINMYRLQDKTIAPAQLFLQSRGLLQTLADPTVDTGAVELGLPVVFGVLLILLSLAESDWKTLLSPIGKAPLIVMTLIGCLFAFMATTLFPWAQVSVITKFFNRIQFAWRFIGPSVALLSLCAGGAYASLSDKKSRHLPLLLLFGALLVILPTLSEQTRRGSFFRFGEGTSGNIIYDEYQLSDTNLRQTTDRSLLVSPDGLISDYEKQGTIITANVHGSGTVEFPLFAFDGYEATLNGTSVPIERGSNNRIRITLPENASGSLRIHYAGKHIWRLADLFSLLSLAALLAWPRIRSKQRHPSTQR